MTYPKGLPSGLWVRVSTLTLALGRQGLEVVERWRLVMETAWSPERKHSPHCYKTNFRLGFAGLGRTIFLGGREGLGSIRPVKPKTCK